MTSVLRIHAQADDPRGLVAGRDLVLDRWAPGDLPDRVLLDDWLSLDDRDRIDGDARDALETFAADHGHALRFDGLDLVDAWRWELLSEVFLWDLRVARGVARAVEALAPSRIEWRGGDREQRSVLEAITGVKGESVGSEPPGPVYPSGFGVGWRPKSGVRMVHEAGLALGLPPSVRGDVLVHGGLGDPLVQALSAGSMRVVLDPASLPAVGMAGLSRLAFRGGWIGSASPRRRSATRRGLRQASAVLERNMGSRAEDVLRQFMERRAIELLRQLAAGTIAGHGEARRALERGRIRAAVLPFDTPPRARALIQAARRAAVPTLIVQHGFPSAAGLFQDGAEGDVAAVWSNADADLLRPSARGRVVVTGNPDREQPSDRERARGRGRTIVLVEYPFRMSARIDSRVKHRHVLTALRALAETRPGTEVVVRPHPGDHEPRALEPLRSRFPALRVAINPTTPFTDLLEGCDLVIAALSTAALEAGVCGVPVIFLNSLGVEVSPPFDGSGDLPTTVSQEGLTELIPAALGASEPPGQEEMRAALGVRPGATAAVIGEIERLVAAGPALDA